MTDTRKHRRGSADARRLIARLLVAGVALLVMGMLALPKASLAYAAKNPYKDWNVEVRTPKTKSNLSNDHEVQKYAKAINAKYKKRISSRRNELGSGTLHIDDMSMDVSVQVKGEPDAHGYPLYIALRGGGNEDEQSAREQYEVVQTIYYSGDIESGVYVVPFGVRARMDEHYLPEDYLFYDRIIEDAIAFYNVDPNRVYLLGFSSGGDGVYSVAPTIPDRFAAANMSAGYPHIRRVDNLYNLPMCLQVGEFDTSYDRSSLVADFDGLLNEAARTYGGGFRHDTYIHIGGTHNEYWSDLGNDLQEIVRQDEIATWQKNADEASHEWRSTGAVAWLSGFVRNPLPKRVLWYTSVYAGLRESQTYYWLGRDAALDDATILASYDKGSNTVTIESCDAESGTLKIYLNSSMVDVFKDVTIDVCGKKVKVRPVVSKKLMWQTLLQRGDSNYVFPVEIDVAFDKASKRVTVTPVARCETGQKKAGKLLYWGRGGMFYVDQSLFGLSRSQLEKKLDAKLVDQGYWPYWSQNAPLDWASCDDLGYPSVIFMFQGGRCVLIYSEAEGAIPEKLEREVKRAYGFDVDSLDNGLLANGGMSWFYVYDNEYGDKHHVVQRYESHEYAFAGYREGI